MSFVRSGICCAALTVTLLAGLLPGTLTAQPVEVQPAMSGATQPLLDINTATLEQLEALPGFGEAYAERIIAGRPYTAKNQIATRGIIPRNAYERVKNRIIAHRIRKGAAHP